MKRYSIGRDDSNDIVIDDRSVSRRHAELVDRGKGVYQIIDSGSSNGTSCLGEAGWESVISAELDADALVRIGDHDTSVSALLMQAGVTPVRAAGGTRPAGEESTRPGRTRRR